jgi:hypothetical protein
LLWTERHFQGNIVLRKLKGEEGLVPRVEFTMKHTNLDPPNRAQWTIGVGDEWIPLAVVNDKAAYDFPEGTVDFLLSINMEGPAGAVAEATMVQKTANGDKPVEPDFKRKIKKKEANTVVRDFQVETL